MAKRVPKAFCSLFDYLRIVDNEFADAMSALCLEHALVKSRSSYGVTFLYPEDKAYRGSIIAAAYGPTPQTALKEFKSLIIYHDLTSGTDCQSRIIGSTGNKVKYDVVSADARTATLKGRDGNCVLEFTGEFARLYENSGLNFVRMKGKGLPLTGESYSQERIERYGEETPIEEKKPKKKRTKAVTGSDEVRVCRKQLFGRCLERMSIALQSGAADNPFLTTVVGFMNWLYTIDKTKYAAIREIIDPCPIVSFMLLFEPFKNSGHLIPDEMIEQWAYAKVYRNAVTDYYAHFDAKDVTFNLAAWQDARVKFFSGMSKLDAGTLILNYYTKNGKNEIDLWRDEFRHVYSRVIEIALEKAADGPYPHFAELYRFPMLVMPGNNYTRERYLTSQDHLTRNVSASAELQMLVRFIYSSDFDYSATKVRAFRWAATPATREPQDVGQDFQRGAMTQNHMSFYSKMEKPQMLSARTIAEIAVARSLDPRNPILAV